MKKILPLIMLLSCSSPKVENQIQLKKDWIKLFKKVGYKGDYYFSSSKSLGI